MQKIVNTLIFLLFIIYTISIFFIENYVIILGLFLINLILFLFFKLSFKDLLYNLKWASLVIFFTVLINIAFESIYSGILLGVRLLLCYFTTYIFSKKIKISELAEVIAFILYPLKIFKIDSLELGIIISIAICMIPVLRSEILSTKNTLISRGQKSGISFIIICVKPLMISILRKTEEMEKTLISKAYK